MKCQNCNSGEYQNTYETYKDAGIKYKRHICSCCDDEYFMPINNKIIL